MASAWGESWGLYWGDSWGSVDDDSGATVAVDRLNLISPADRTDDPSLPSRLYEMLEQILNGRTRNTAEVTLTANSDTTTVLRPLFESHQVVVLVPQSASAAAELAAGTTYISARSNGQFTITHANSADSTRVFGLIFVG